MLVSSLHSIKLIHQWPRSTASWRRTWARMIGCTRSTSGTWPRRVRDATRRTRLATSPSTPKDVAGTVAKRVASLRSTRSHRMRLDSRGATKYGRRQESLGTNSRLGPPLITGHTVSLSLWQPSTNARSGGHQSSTWLTVFWWPTARNMVDWYLLTPSSPTRTEPRIWVS